MKVVDVDDVLKVVGGLMMTSSRLLEDCSRRFFVFDTSSNVDVESVVDVKRCDGMLTGSLADDFLKGDDDDDVEIVGRSCKLFFETGKIGSDYVCSCLFSNFSCWNNLKLTATKIVAYI